VEVFFSRGGFSLSGIESGQLLPDGIHERVKPLWGFLPLMGFEPVDVSRSVWYLEKACWGWDITGIGFESW
jgi:hypothetical protein